MNIARIATAVAASACLVTLAGGAAQAAPTTADTPAPLQNVDAAADFDNGLAKVATQFGLAAGVGTMGGGLVGMGIGCVAGALTGGFVALPTGPIALPAAVFGCLVGASVGAGIGGALGGAMLGIPVGLSSGSAMYNTITTPNADSATGSEKDSR
ncbi:hypothetical protein ACQP1O_22350 [Nocardia sp. CA-151230]|uniref:hypothetical protein n=1 Tax=Nocardia sp. CA-151230 TaxID=3239982 RepID=UPI003D8BD8BC